MLVEVEQEQEPVHPILDAVARNDVGHLHAIIRKFKEKIDECDTQGRTAVYLAAKSNFKEALSLLIEAGACVSTPSANGWTPLHAAAQENAMEALDVLLAQSGVVKNYANNKKKWTPLHLAAAKSEPAIVKKLLNAGCDRTRRDSENQTPEDLAKSKGRGEDVLNLFQSPPLPNTDRPKPSVAWMTAMVEGMDKKEHRHLRREEEKRNARGVESNPHSWPMQRLRQLDANQRAKERGAEPHLEGVEILDGCGKNFSVSYK